MYLFFILFLLPLAFPAARGKTFLVETNSKEQKVVGDTEEQKYDDVSEELRDGDTKGQPENGSKRWLGPPRSFWRGQCVIDKPDRVMQDFRIKNASMTRAFCGETCASKGYKYAGVEFETHCFCSYAPPPQSLIAPIEQCNLPCAGNKKEMCGGGWRLNVFAV